VHVTTTQAHVGLRFETSSLVLLGEVLRAGTRGGRIRHVSLVLRSPGPTGRLTTELIDTFSTAVVGSFTERLSGKPTGSVSLVLPAVSHVVSTPSRLQRVGPFAQPPGGPPGGLVTKAYLQVAAADGNGARFYPITSVQLSQAAGRSPIDVGFVTSSLPVLDAIFQGQSNAADIPLLRLSVRAGGGGHPFVTALTDTFSSVSVGSLVENLSGSISGTVSLMVR